MSTRRPEVGPTDADPPPGHDPIEVMAGLVPAGCSVAGALDDLVEAAEDHQRHPAEVAAMSAATAGRRAEFATGRLCARRAVRALTGTEPTIAVGESREPLWPSGLVGSITHCVGFRAAAVMHGGAVRGLGIDAEQLRAAPGSDLDQHAFGAVIDSAGDLDRVTAVVGDAATAPRLLFSAKEAVFKACFPLTRVWLEFDQVTLDVRLAGPDPGHDGGTFSATLPPTLAAMPVRGRWAIAGDLVLTCAVLTRACAVVAPARS